MSSEKDLTDQLENLHITDDKPKSTSDESEGRDNKILDSFDLEGVVEYIKSLLGDNTEEKLKIITLAGAGISTAAGIPDFRSPKTGLYDNLEEYNLNDPMEVFSLKQFYKDPTPFFQVSRKLVGSQSNIKPTPTHYFINLLNQKGHLLRHYTQNVDGLEVTAGVPEDKIVEAHGHFRTGHCVKCKKAHNEHFLKEHILGEELKLPFCTRGPDCDGVVKPDIVFFGEALPARFNECLETDFDQCNLLIIIGTSLVVSPFNQLPNFVDRDVPRLFINRELAGAPMACAFNTSVSNTRDVFYQSDADEGVQKLLQLLGWQEDLAKLTNAQ